MEPRPASLFRRMDELPTGLPARWMAGVGVASFIALLLEHGYVLRTTWVPALHGLGIVLALHYGVDRIGMLWRARHWRTTLRARFYEFAVLVAFGGMMMGLFLWPEFTGGVVRFLHASTAEALMMDVVQVFLLGNLLIHLLRIQQHILAQGYRPELILTGSFAMIIVGGTLLLLLPRASGDPERPITVMEAFFTSTSACCVTGLIVRDTGTAFSPLGQAVILTLLQVGGLGIMAFVAFLAVTSAKSLPVGHLMAFKHLVNARSLAGLRRQVLLIVGGTLLIEGLGAACLFLLLPPETDGLRRLFWSVFHAASAFCNAGFALAADSLTGWQTNGPILLVVMALIVLGSFGFLVIADLISLRASRWPGLRGIPWCRRYNQRTPIRRLPVQTRLSLIVTGVLLLAGFLGFWMIEAGHILNNRDFIAQGWIAMFQSVTTRTAGFNTVPLDQLQPATLILMMALMVVGACPVSTGGGVKTVTLGVLALTLRALARGRPRVEIFGRSLPQAVVHAALSVFILYVATAALGVFGLAWCDPETPLRDLAFELISALSTVGLSTGITAGLSTGGKLILCAAMFVGRVGPLSLVLSMFQSAPLTLHEYPEEELLVG